MATRDKTEKKIREKKSESIENETIMDASTEKAIEQKRQINPQSFPVVGIGASAGGLAAFEAFFSGMPTGKNPEMAFVFVQHLAPDHKSILTEIIQRYTKMQVFTVEDGMTVKPGCTYIIPPNRNMALSNGTLLLFEPTPLRGQIMPIDFFFRTLANDQHERAICIILSGTGSDGTLGLRAVKAEGGIVIAQSLDTTEYNGMPASAIATGLVDYQLPPNEMVKQIVSYITHSYRLFNEPKVPKLSNNENMLKKVFLLIRTQTGHDFSQYNPNSINRGIERRLAVHQIETMANYVKYLQQTPAEIEVLFRDLLIGVTSFFRDKDAYKKLEEEIIPKLFESKPEGSTIRVWCVGCSTGEEAYSIAILLKEHLERIKKSYNIKVFATDIDGKAITIARKGVYSGNISADLTSERIARFFVAEPGNTAYCIKSTIRNMLIFSEHSIIKDPSFSELDLISCRNLLIYLNSELQKKIILQFHNALSPNGILFLGSSETVGVFNSLYKVLDKKFKFYQYTKDFQETPKAMTTQILPQAMKKVIVNNKDEFIQPIINDPRAIIEQFILHESSISGALVNGRGDIIYIHGRTGLYLEPSQGKSRINNIIAMARQGLKREITLALHNASVKKEIVRLQAINVKTNDHFTKINLVIKPIATGLASTSEQDLYIVLLDEEKEQEYINKPETKEADLIIDLNTQLETLKNEIFEKEVALQTAFEDLNSANEELTSTNEELQSINEELHSTNEELITISSELQDKVETLYQINNDIENMLSGTNIATIFLDYKLRILRFTSTANKIINVIESDIGRPVAHIVTNMLNYNHLILDVKTVLDTLLPREIQVQTIDSKWYNMIIQPYRTIDNVIEGAVLTFVDITEAKNAKNMLAISEMSYRTLFETAQVGVLILDGITGKILNVNPFLIDLLGYSQKSFIGKEIWNLGVLKDIVANKKNFLVLQKKKYIRYKNLPLETINGTKIDVEFISNLYEIDQQKIIQCNIRVATHIQEPEEEINMR